MRLLGTLHGVLVTLLLLRGARTSTPSRLLACLVAVHVLRLAAPAAIGVGLLAGPALVLYVACATGRWVRLGPKALVHLLPPLLSVVMQSASLDPSFAVPPLGLAYTLVAAAMLRGYVSRANALGALVEVRPRVRWLASLVGVHGLAWLLAWFDLRVLSETLVVHWIGVAIAWWPFIARDRLRHPGRPEDRDGPARRRIR
jgi:hypothetical protein